MVRMSSSEARRDFAETVNQVAYRHKRVVLERHGHRLAAIVPIKDLEYLEQCEEEGQLGAARLPRRGRAPRSPHRRRR